MYSSHHLTFPLKDKTVLDSISLKDEVYISGIIVTSRDMAHKYYVESIKNGNKIDDKLKQYLKNGLIYHCGPVVKLDSKEILSAGPTTSAREEPYQKDVIGYFDLAAVMGKGGMGEKTLAGLKEHKALYLHAVGGAGSFYAEKMKVLEVFKLEEFGVPEAIWVLEVENLYSQVSMNYNGNSLHKQVQEESLSRLQQIYLK